MIEIKDREKANKMGKWILLASIIIFTIAVIKYNLYGLGRITLVGLLEFLVSYIVPYILTKDKELSIKIAIGNVILMVILSKLTGLI